MKFEAKDILELPKDLSFAEAVSLIGLPLAKILYSNTNTKNKLTGSLTVTNINIKNKTITLRANNE